jgi:hypothetical protein
MKIGKSRNPEERLKQMQTGCPGEMKMMAKIRCRSEMHALYVERLIHRNLKRYHIRGEWFRCADVVVQKGWELEHLSDA